MELDDHICVCHRVSLRKLRNYLERETPSVASQLSSCLDAGTGCGWCVPFLEQLHRQHQAGEEPGLKVDGDRYVDRRRAYKDRGCAHGAREVEVTEQEKS